MRIRTQVGRLVLLLLSGMGVATGATAYEKTISANGGLLAGGACVLGNGGLCVVGTIPNVSGAGDLDVGIVRLSPAGDPVWDLEMGDPWFERGRTAISTPDGGVVILGETSDASGNITPFLSKITGSGSVVWARKYPIGGLSEVHDVTLASDGGFVVVGDMVAGQAYMLKTFSNGIPDWLRLYAVTGSGIYHLNAVEETPTGMYLAAGYTNAFGSGGNDVLLLQVDASGNSGWMKSYGHAGYDQAFDLALRPSGTTHDVVLAGNTAASGSGPLLLETNAAGAITWANVYTGGGSASSFGAVPGGYLLGTDIDSKASLLLIQSSGALTWGRRFSQISPWLPVVTAARAQKDYVALATSGFAQPSSLIRADLAGRTGCPENDRTPIPIAVSFSVVTRVISDPLGIDEPAFANLSSPVDPDFGRTFECGPCVSLDGIEAWWAGDVCDATDLLGNHHGTYYGFPDCPIDPKVPEGALSFYPNTYAIVPHSPLLDPDGGDFTVEGWIRTSASGQQTIVNKEPGYYLQLDNGRLQLSVCDPSTCWAIQSTTTINDGAWHHVAVVISRPGGIDLDIAVYIDGLLEGARSVGPAGNLTSSGDLGIGVAPPFGSPWRIFIGAMDELTVFRRALAEEEILAIFGADSGGKCRPLNPVSVDASTETGGGLRIAAGPNPFQGQLSFEIAADRPGDLRIEIFDSGGRVIREVARGFRRAGIHRFEWDGRDASGAPTPSGVYWIRTSGGAATSAALKIVHVF